MKNSILLIFFITIINNTSFSKTHEIENYLPHNIEAIDEDLFKYFMGDKKSRDIGLNLLLETRSLRYAPSDLYYQSNLSNAIKDMVRTLDVDLHLFDTDPAKTWAPKGFVLAAFKNELVSLLNSTETNRYLSSLEEALIKALGGLVPVENPDFNLWEFTLKHFNLNKMKAAKYIAVLFQDTTFAKLHLELLDIKVLSKSKLYIRNIELLSDNLSRISMALTHNSKLAKKLFFPKLNILEDLNPNFYHFYVPMYLSMRLVEKSHKPYFAMTAAWLLTLTYEIASLEDDYRNILRDPKTLTNSWAIGDIYTGYIGTIIGTGYQQAIKKEYLIKECAKNYSNTIRSIFQFHVGKFKKQNQTSFE